MEEVKVVRMSRPSWPTVAEIPSRMSLPGRVHWVSPVGRDAARVQPSAWRSWGQVVCWLYLAAMESVSDGLARLGGGCVGSGVVRSCRSHWSLLYLRPCVALRSA